MRRSEWMVGLGYVGVLAILAVAGQWARQGGGPTCGHDGGLVDPLYRVRVVGDDGSERVFCGIVCAEAWLRGNEKKPRAVFVTDEVSGAEIPAASAYYARSQVITNRATRNRVHVFRTAAEAEEHARACGGVVLDEADRPFACCQCSACPHCK